MNTNIAQEARAIFASNFRHYLSITGKNQNDIAAYLGVSSSTVSDWANGKKYPRVDKMQALADHLGVLISDLRDKKKPPTEVESKKDEVMAILKSLPEEAQEEVADYIRYILTKYANDPK